MAEFLLNLNENDNEYNSYLWHKTMHRNPVTNRILLDRLAARPYQTKTLVPDFECFVCSHRFGKRITKGYECGEKLIFPRMEEGRVTELDWQSYVRQGKCEAETLEYFVNKNVPFGEQDFSNLLLRRYNLGLCEV